MGCWSSNLPPSQADGLHRSKSSVNGWPVRLPQCHTPGQTSSPTHAGSITQAECSTWNTQGPLGPSGSFRVHGVPWVLWGLQGPQGPRWPSGATGSFWVLGVLEVHGACWSTESLSSLWSSGLWSLGPHGSFLGPPGAPSVFLEPLQPCGGSGFTGRLQIIRAPWVFLWSMRVHGGPGLLDVPAPRVHCKVPLVPV